MEERTCLISTPLGTMRLSESDRGITALRFLEEVLPETEPAGQYLAEGKRQLLEYFAGTRREFDLPLDPRGTAFQRAVWTALGDIPYGQTRSYQDIARQIGNPKAVRAVGMANHRNPLPIFIPCHRVVGKDGGLTGYAGGLDRKQRLLALEASAP